MRETRELGAASTKDISFKLQIDPPKENGIFSYNQGLWPPKTLKAKLKSMRFPLETLEYDEKKEK